MSPCSSSHSNSNNGFNVNKLKKLLRHAQFISVYTPNFDCLQNYQMLAVCNIDITITTTPLCMLLNSIFVISKISILTPPTFDNLFERGMKILKKLKILSKF